MESARAETGLPEQITERAIEKLEDDSFGHEDFVQRLVKIIRGTKTPANIALFGRWGSGKSGIANRLRSEFPPAFEPPSLPVEDMTAAPLFQFVVFDAFKFARLPLLRRFLIQLAGELGGPAKAKEYMGLVYERKEQLRLGKLSDEAKAALWKWTEWILWGLIAALLVLNALALKLSEDSTQNLLDHLGSILPIVAPVSLVGGALLFAARYLSASTTTETPSSEEQFEHLFAQLLNEAKIEAGAETRKLVVFVDELDRCSASEVAETLEGLKTFLEMPGCIFIVAADQAVLEHALSQKVRQATPRDLTNPYYSAGSAYLDKIFQDQVTLPPLFPGRLTGFALELLEEVGGVWDEVPNKGEVVSVLLPVNVRSPRRVKVLLNAFAQAFALALARVDSKKLHGNVRSRTDELAKLVGLQTEFPLFAADLATHRNLPELVLACANALADGNEPDPMELEVMQAADVGTRELALGYADGSRAPDLALDGAAAIGQSPADGGPEDQLRQAQGGALIDYLRQTERVEGPKTDLVHLEGLGLASGIDEDLASELEDLVFKNRPGRVRELIEGLEEPDRSRATARLLELIRESRGNDFDNAIRALLIAFPAVADSIGPPSTTVVSAVARHDLEPGFAGDELPGALELAIAGSDRPLQRSVLGRAEAEHEPLRAHALKRADDLLEGNARRLGRLMFIAIVEAPAETGAMLNES